MSENEEPDRLTELVKGGEARSRQIDLLVQGVAQLARNTGWPKTASLALLSPPRLAAAADADVRVLNLALPAAYVWAPQARQISIVSPALVVRTGRLALPPMRFSGQATVANPPSGKLKASIGQILALVLLWLVILAVPAAVTATDLSPEAQAMLDAYDAIFAALAVKIAFRILDERK